VGSFGGVDLFIDYDGGDGNDVVLFTSPGLQGDYDDDGFVGQQDLDLVLLHWGENVPPDPIPSGWVNQQPVGLIGQEALDGVLLNWGDGQLPILASVPEPSTLLLLLLPQRSPIAVGLLNEFSPT